jgi:hypothetical protein
MNWRHPRDRNRDAWWRRNLPKAWMTSTVEVALGEVLVVDGAGEDRNVASVWVGELLVRVLRRLGRGGSAIGGSGTRAVGTLPDRQPPNLARSLAV